MSTATGGPRSPPSLRVARRFRSRTASKRSRTFSPSVAYPSTSKTFWRRRLHLSSIVEKPTPVPILIPMTNLLQTATSTSRPCRRKCPLPLPLHPNPKAFSRRARPPRQFLPSVAFRNWQPTVEHRNPPPPRRLHPLSPLSPLNPRNDPLQNMHNL